ncbi:MAG: branched-chain amino acid ABC transporter permease [Alphaproteobacteria bacterium]|nr:branched-chain amino acid ABC transporter permease [Alphaproteobacteria bacterium]MBT3395555.1 branched-chain amino acid ABC transporter permease [Alphaproteobacteria bacterium]MBT4711222.1 branched-chain amino acid ABC transporter permease [Alphaproteobacteria bacterium]MBT5860399.1 branched-chain amino acid ABC transporter permease [Alphaproteobacteria bacterium]
MAGYGMFAVGFLTFVAIYAVLTLGLNIQWGLAGQFNIGIAGFFAVGAYTSAILTTEFSTHHLGGFNLPIPLGMVGAMIAAGILALLIGVFTVKLRGDYLAIATIGIAESVRIILKNEEWLTNGVRGIVAIPQPFQGLVGGRARQVIYLAIALLIVAMVYAAVERLRKSPWGRALRAQRENEDTAMASGKDVVSYRLQAFVLGSMIMGLAGAMYAHYLQFITTTPFKPVFGTFIVWIMLIAGGSGNNKGALLGAFFVWGIWNGSEILLTSVVPVEFATQASAGRIVMVGVLIVAVLLWRPDGFLPEARVLPGAGGKDPPPKIPARK